MFATRRRGWQLLQFIWACVETLADRLGLEAIAAFFATLLKSDQMSVAHLAADIVLLTIIITAVEKARDFARRDIRLLAFLTFEGLIGFGTLVYAWVDAGADPDIALVDLVGRSQSVFLVPWVLVFVLSPLLLVIAALREKYISLGGATVPLRLEVSCFLFFFLPFFLLNVLVHKSLDSLWELVVQSTIEALVPTMLLLLWIAHRRRGNERRLITKSPRWDFRSGPKSYWAAPHEMTEVQYRYVRRRLKEWTKRSLGK